MDLLLLVLVIVALISLVALLVVLMYRQSRSQTQMLMTTVSLREATIQSLLNQLRSQSPSDLLTLNAATTSSHLIDPDAYISQSDSAEFSRLPVGIGDELTQEDLMAFGAPFITDDH